MKSGCRERRLCRPGAMASPQSRNRLCPSGDAPSLEYQGRLRHPSLTLTPQKARHRPASKAGTGTAALRLQAYLFVLACGQQWALPRGVLSLAERLVHRFLLSSWLIPAEVCPGAVPPARGVHKNARTAARTACLRVRVSSFLQSFPVHSSHPRCRRLTGLELSKKR